MMGKINNNPLVKKQEQGKQFRVQKKRVFAAFYKQPKTMKMVEAETGIDRSNVCRYVSEWHKQETVKIIRFGICPISKRNGVQFLSTNPMLFPHIAKLSKKDKK